MAGSVNRVILVGHLGKDPEVRRFQNGGQVVSFSLATSSHFKDRDGNRQEATEWHRVSIFNEALGDVAEKYLRKGSAVYVEGRLETRKWQDKDGQDRYTTEVVLRAFGSALQLLGGSGGADRGDAYEGDDRPAPRRQAPPPAASPGGARSMSDMASARERQQNWSRGDLDDDIPF